MAITYVDLEDTYLVKSAAKDLSIEVEIGDAQVGAYTIFLDQALKGTNAPAPLGIKADVTGKIATIVTTVKDTLDETNWTSVTISVVEGRSKTALLSIRAGAQDNDVKKLTIPSSPAFSILSFEPTSVMRPTSNKDLATDVLNAFDKDGKLIMNLGMEVSPYWLQSQPTLTREQYVNPEPWQALKQSFSLSAATVKDSASGANKFGAGFRFKVINGKPSPERITVEKRLVDTITILSDIAFIRTSASFYHSVNEAIDSLEDRMTRQGFASDVTKGVISDAHDIAGEYTTDASGIRSFAEALNNSIDFAALELVKKVNMIAQQRLAFILEFAAATAFNTSKNNELEKAGAWVNLSNYVSATDLFTLTGRYMLHNGDTTLSNIDIGLAYMKKSDKYNVSIEYMLRWSQGQIPDVNISGQQIKRLANDFSYRLAVQGAYLLSPQISINISFGKDFGSPFISSSGFFSILGLNYSIFNHEQVK